VAGYAFVSGIQFVFPEGSAIGPRQHVLLAKCGLTYADGGYPVFQWERGSLANEGELLVLVDARGNAVDMVRFGVSDPWPEAPDGGGPSLMIIDPALPNAAAWNWRAGGGQGGTPGRANWLVAAHIGVLPATGDIEISWIAESGFEYRAEYRPSLRSGDWIPLGAPVMVTGEHQVCVHRIPLPGHGSGVKGFYRVCTVLPGALPVR